MTFCSSGEEDHGRRYEKLDSLCFLYQFLGLHRRRSFKRRDAAAAPGRGAAEQGGPDLAVPADEGRRTIHGADFPGLGGRHLDT